jgi:hypothetical protein
VHPDRPAAPPRRAPLRALPLLAAAGVPLLLGTQCPPPGSPPVATPGWTGRWTGDLIAYLPEVWPNGAPAYPRPEQAAEACLAMGEVDGRAARLLFGDADMEIAGDDVRGTELGRFCLLEAARSGMVPGATDLEALAMKLVERGESPDVDVQKDVVPAGFVDADLGSVMAIGTVDPEASPHLISLTAQRVQASNPKLALAAAQRGARVLVLDTHPTGAVADGPRSYDHGGSMIRIIKALLCPSGFAGCPVQLHSVQALPYQVDPGGRVQADPTLPGHFGTLASVARAVRRGSAVAAGASDPAVFNLSFGWNPAFTFAGVRAAGAEPPADGSAGAEPARLLRYDQLPAGSKAVMAALIDARCRGHLPVAAAGNRSNGGPIGATAVSPYDGPMLPARWMEVVAEDSDHPGLPPCPRVMGPDASGAPQLGAWASGGPLVVAASGLGQVGPEYGLARPSSRSPFGALAESVAVDAGDGTTALVDGTSASAAITSSAFAASWALASDKQTADGQIRALMELFSSTREAIDFGQLRFTGAPKEQAQVELCRVLRAGDPTLTCDTSAFPIVPPAAAVGAGAPEPAAGVHDCASAAGPPDPACDGADVPSVDLRLGVIPLPPDLGCPPCDLELAGDPVLDLGPLFNGAAPRASWRGDDWTGAGNSISSGYLEIKQPLGKVFVVNLDLKQIGVSQIEPGVSRIGFSLSGVVAQSATLVLIGQQSGKSVSWNVPIPIVR